MENSFKKYLDSYYEKLQAGKSDSSIPEDVKLSYEYTAQAYRNIIEKFEWFDTSQENKQSKRILQLAKSREQDWNTKDQLNEINLYSKIREVIPYIMAVSYKINMENKHLTEDLLNFCENQLEIIDSSPYKRKIIFPTKVEVEMAFKSYTERIKLNKIPSLKVYNQPEVNIKIEELYQMFLRIAI